MQGTERQFNDELVARIADLVALHQGYRRDRITLATCLAEDTGMDGDDADEFLKAFAKEFAVDFAGFRFYHHFGSEGFDPLWLFWPPWWMKVVHIPLSVGDLVAAAMAGRWLIVYPDDPVYQKTAF